MLQHEAVPTAVHPQTSEINPLEVFGLIRGQFFCLESLGMPSGSEYRFTSLKYGLVSLCSRRPAQLSEFRVCDK